MVGYHATPFVMAKKILKSGVIKRTNHDNMLYTDTTRGFVHLATNFKCAMDFGIRAVGHARNNSITEDGHIVVFKVELHIETQFFDDPDELSGVDTGDVLENIGITNTFRVSKDLVLGEEVTSYLPLKLDRNTEIIWRYYDQGRFDEAELFHYWKPCNSVRTNRSAHEF